MDHKMSKLVVGICDDLREDRIALAHTLQSSCRELQLTAELLLFASGRELLDKIRHPGQLHILFLDIYMPGLSGMEAARRLRQIDKDVMIVFATTSCDHGPDSFDVYAEDYLVKPFQPEEVSSTLCWCLEQRTANRRSLLVYSDWETQDVLLSSIVYIEILDHRAYIYCTNGRKLVTRRGLDDLEKEVNSPDFLRCHRSFLVNMNHIKNMDEPGFRMSNGTVIPIGSTNKMQVRNKFIDWLYIKTRLR